MVRYKTSEEHRRLILTGLKDFTIRRITDKRQARLGETFAFEQDRLQGTLGSPDLSLTTDRYATAQCVLRCRIVIGPGSLLRVLELSERPGRAEGLRLLLRAAEQGASQAEIYLPRLAQRDGFDSWADLYAYHRAQQHKNGPLLRELIGWDVGTVSTVNPVLAARAARGEGMDAAGGRA